VPEKRDEPPALALFALALNSRPKAVYPQGIQRVEVFLSVLASRPIFRGPPDAALIWTCAQFVFYAHITYAPQCRWPLPKPLAPLLFAWTWNPLKVAPRPGCSPFFDAKYTRGVVGPLAPLEMAPCPVWLNLARANNMGGRTRSDQEGTKQMVFMVKERGIFTGGLFNK